MKIRINDLARELEVKSKAILDVLDDVGVTEKKTHSSSLEEDEAERVRKHFAAKSGSAVRERTPSSDIKPKIDLSKISKPGDVARLLREREQQQHQPPAPPVRPAATAPPTVSKPAVAPPAAKPQAPAASATPTIVKPAVVVPKPAAPAAEKTAVVTPPPAKPAPPAAVVTPPPAAEKPAAPPAVVVTPPSQPPAATVVPPQA